MDFPKLLASGEVARLIPVVSESSKEARAASVLLATLSAVPMFASTMLSSLGQRTGVRANLGCFTEIVFKENSKDKSRPDGLIILDGGRGRVWHCLVEAKIKNQIIEKDQVERYIGIAKSNNIDAILTISNEFVAMPSHSPLHLPKSVLKGVELFHWSWMYALTMAKLLVDEDNFERPEQKYILSEMVRFFAHPSIGISKFDRMNSEWKDIVIKIQSGAILNKSDPAVENTIGAWHQESRDLCLFMSEKLNRRVQLKISRAHSEDPLARVRDDGDDLSKHHRLECVLDIPDAASPLTIVADLARRTVIVSMTLIAPKDKQKSSSRINWLIRQLAKTKPEGIHVKAMWPGRATDTQAPLALVREDSSVLEQENKSITPTSFEVMLVRDLAGKFSGAKTFIEQLEIAVPKFYEEVGEHLTAYVAPPPRIKKELEEQATSIQETPSMPENAITQENSQESETDRISDGVKEIQNNEVISNPSQPPLDEGEEFNGPPFSKGG